VTIIRSATGDDAPTIAHLLDAFNRAFGSPTPRPRGLTDRLGRLLAGPDTAAILAR
jgi:hypothetical protein